jgi:hypothetical protein
VRGRMGGMKQFSIRDVLLLVVIVALALGWWFDTRPIPARFQLQSNGKTAVVLDTATGQLWASDLDKIPDAPDISTKKVGGK